nr:6233_t:CDS:10 [Entrophospora candida]
MTLTKLDSKGYSPRTIIIDNYDSYTFNLLQLLNNTENVIVIRNDQFSWTEFEQNILPHFDNIIISPGPGSPENSSDFGICSKILKLNNIPILGVCLGHQGIGYAFGGKIKNAERIMHGRSSLIYHDGGDGDISLFSGIPNPFWAVRYHSLVVDNENLPSELIVSACHSLEKSSKIMGLKHIKEPIYGVQFHPEAWFSICTEYGYKIIKNFNEITKKYHGKKQGLTFSRPKLPYNISALSVIPSNFFIFNPITRINNNKPKYYLVMKQFHENKWLDPYLVFKEIQQDSQNGFSFMGSTPNFSNTFSVSYSTLEKDLKIHCTNGKIISKKLEENQTFWDWMSNATRLINQNIGITKILKNNGLLYDILKLKKKEHLIIPFDFRLGMVGYFGYEMKCESMPGYVKVVPNGVGPNNKCPDSAFIFSTYAIVFDHLKKRLWSIGLIKNDDGNSLIDYNELEEDYELCLTTQFHTKLPNKLKNIDDILELYYYIRSNNPAPYSAFIYFNNLSLSILSSSPEKFLEIDDKGVIEMKPIKGTVAKANKCFCEKKTNETKDQYYDNKCDNEECCKIKRKEEDLRRIYMLKRNVKERAENLMIVDLIRNDLSQICIPNTVKVPYLMKVESYKSVHQLVTTVKGNLNRNIDYVNVIKNCFPPGSMTGAPKLRSVQLLEKLENYTPRGVYSGCLGYISLNEPNNPNNCGGGAHFSVVIRTVIICDEKDISVGAGGAIINLSNPETEWQEVLLKSQSVIPR